jgi:hypothetical protein
MTSLPLEVFSDPDVVSREDELRAFIGPDADKYIRAWQGEQAAIEAKRTGTKPLVKRQGGFVVMGFFLGPAWFFYRKMWLWGWAFVGLILVLAFLPLPRGVSAPIGFAVAFMGRSVYLQHASARIAKLRGAGPVDLALLRARGGVSKLWGWLSFPLMLVGFVAIGVVVALVDPSLIR